ncbi:MAG: STAS domain-containing protein [Synergistaceae bacterium]|nr:STAS domain-containing protein [Synergistaceae bacterium]
MKSETFEITKEQDEEQGVARFTVIGRVNSKTSPALKNELEDALNSGEVNIVLNMFQVEYLSSDGIRIILKIYKEAEQAGGKLRIEKPSEMVRSVLGMVALNGMLI